MEFDLVLEEIGEFGRYQQINYLLICLPVLFGAANSLSYVFTAGIPTYRCRIPECDDQIDANYDEPWVQNVIPGEITSTGLFVPSICEKFQYDKIQNNNITNPLPNKQCPAEWFSSQTTAKCDDWVFDKSERTIVNDWKITCDDNQWKLSLVGTLHFAGIVFGSAMFGFLSDRFGRKLSFVLCTLMMSVTGIGTALSTDYTTFGLFTFLNAVGTSGVYPLAFIIGVEMVGAKKREMAGSVLNYFYSIGEAALGLVAWLTKDWILTQYIVAAPVLLFFVYYWLLPESVRWLLAKNQNEKAEKIIRKAANVNGVVLSDTLLQSFSLKSSNDHANNKLQRKLKDRQNLEVWGSFKQILVSKTMLVRCIYLGYIWATNALVYYGLSLNSTSLSGNKYLNFILVCLAEIPGLSIAWIAMNKWGRRFSMASSFILCAVACMASGLIKTEHSSISIVLFLIGKMGITSSFAVVYVHTAELFPTIIRSGGVGSMSTIARFGALLAPFVPLLSRFHTALPLLLFGGVSLLAGILSMCLPETLGEKLPDTVDEAVHMGKGRKNEV